MSLRIQAEQDLGFILEGAYGFSWPIRVTDPSGKTEDLKGFSDDISQLIDPDTGQLVSGRVASAAIRMSSLTEAGFTDIPHGVADTSEKPWIITFDDINGTEYTFKVRQSDPDRALGLLICLLEAYTS